MKREIGRDKSRMALNNLERGRRRVIASPPGVQILYGEEVEKRRAVERTLREIFAAWGYREIIVPMFDYLETFTEGLGEQLLEKTYRFLDRDGSVLALRPDLTTLVAKAAAARLADAPLPIKAMYAGDVFRFESARGGQRREFRQIGLEYIGSAGLAADVEVLVVAIEGLRSLEVGRFKLVLGHVGFFNGIAEALALEPERARELQQTIDKKDAYLLEKTIADLKLPPEKRRFLIMLPHFTGGGRVIREAKAAVKNVTSRRALEELERIYDTLAALGLDQYISFDLGEVRDLEYYTGIVFKIYAENLGFDLGGGGRYDSLLRTFGRDLPAVGFSFSLDRIAALLGGRRPAKRSRGERATVIPVTSDSLVEAFSRAARLRARGKPVRLIPT